MCIRDSPNDTLILVTADHETGGMAIGYKTTNYDTFLTNLTHQKMSYAKFDSTYVKGYIANKTPFEAAMADVKANFGLTPVSYTHLSGGGQHRRSAAVFPAQGSAGPAAKCLRLQV